MSKNTRKEMKKRSKAWHKYRSFRSSSNYEAYKSVRNKVTSLIRADEDAYRKRLLKDFKGNPRRFYRHMRKLQTVKDNVTALKTRSGQLTTSDQEAADTLGEYFQEVFTQEDNTTIDRPAIASGFRPTALAIDFSRDTVMKHLQKLAEDISAGPDDIHPMLLKKCATAVAEPLSIICKQVIGRWADWKKAKGRCLTDRPTRNISVE